MNKRYITVAKEKLHVGMEILLDDQQHVWEKELVISNIEQLNELKKLNLNSFKVLLNSSNSALSIFENTDTISVCLSNDRFESINSFLDDAIFIFNNLNILVKKDIDSFIEGLLVYISEDWQRLILFTPSLNRSRDITHAFNTCILAYYLGKSAGLDNKRLNELAIASFFHDIGLMKMEHKFQSLRPSNSYVLSIQYREHSLHGMNFMKTLGFSETIQKAIYQHHESVNGSGYPLGLKGYEIELTSKIISIVNRYDDLCMSYDKLTTPHEALTLMYTSEKNLFDDSLLATFIKMIGIYPIGSFVQLTNDDYGLVISTNNQNYLKPYIILYNNDFSFHDTPIFNLNEYGQFSIKKSLHFSALPIKVKRFYTDGLKNTFLFDIYKMYE